MDLPIVMRDSISTTDRWRRFLTATVCVVIAGGLVLAFPWARDHEGLLVPLIDAELFRDAYVLILLLLLLVAMNLLFNALFKADSTWTIDEEGITEHLRFIGGQRTRHWPLSRIKKVRIRKAADEGTRYYIIEVQLDRGGWREMRSYVDLDQANDFKQVIEDLLATR